MSFPNILQNFIWSYRWRHRSDQWSDFYYLPSLASPKYQRQVGTNPMKLHGSCLGYIHVASYDFDGIVSSHGHPRSRRQKGHNLNFGFGLSDKFLGQISLRIVKMTLKKFKVVNMLLFLKNERLSKKNKKRVRFTTKRNKLLQSTKKR